ncbi:MAG TPA: cytochrome c3 family protein [Anaeromyxobacter sp.]|nr:cytochrome c3 family protein [Anaeromyxobacter sp.]
MTALVVALALSALPTPPTQVKYAAETGDVMFDHAAHVARREPCRTCHGNGPAQKVELGRQKAHVLCVGCHAAARAGPKSCYACHGA